MTNTGKERALLQCRVQGIPYKKIGERIGKTDLACRLHYHQMVTAKRTPETAPGRSIVFFSSEHPPEVHRLAPLQSTLATSTALSLVCNPDRLSVSNNSEPGSRLQREPMHRRSYSSPQINHDGGASWQPIASPYSDRQAAQQTPSMVDMSRLNTIYKQHANDFWSTIAEKYSGGSSLNPLELEQAFLQGQFVEESSPEIPRITLSSSVPPITTTRSPDVSPDIRYAHEFSHVRSSSAASSIAGRCSVESLLNHGTT